ncbi:MAG TPA: chaperone modulator CbpM [Gemmataceae bacterium]|nr:chaperone modulator CbpM [Gemmataceae bacterium]
MPGQNLMLHPAAAQFLTLEALAMAVDLHPQVIETFVAYGLLEPLSAAENELRFDVRAVSQLQTIRRLREDLGINLPGIAAVLDLLERIETLQRQLAHLRDR